MRWHIRSEIGAGSTARLIAGPIDKRMSPPHISFGLLPQLNSDRSTKRRVNIASHLQHTHTRVRAVSARVLTGEVMANGVVLLDLPANATIQITGLTNAQGWSEQIIVEPLGGPALTWTGTGAQSNQVVGQHTMPPSAGPTQVKVQMQYNSGSGYQLSEVQVVPFSLPEGGLSGYVVGGQDGGGRPSGPAFWNTLAFIYFAPGY